jgi:tRNA(Arg) A34 adenosine deaminase TadA
MKKSISIVFLLIVIIVVIIYLMRSEFFRVFPNTELVSLSKRELRNTAIQAIIKGDEPVSAVILYNYSLIGRGYNTILSDTNAVGHAVINALNNAIKGRGWEQFNALDKNSIIVMSTTEPCQLCKAALQEYGISRIEFMNKSQTTYWLNSYWHDFIYEIKKRQLEPSDLQDSLIQIKASRQINYQP